MKFLTLAVLASAISTATAYPITADDVKCRSGPGTSFAVKKTYKKDTNVDISCQTEGTDIFGNSIWDKTQDGCYVSDYYVKTGSDGYVTDKCEGGGCSPPKSNSATVDLIAEFEGFVSTICKLSNSVMNTVSD
jgi:uncharacterized protein YraI